MARNAKKNKDGLTERQERFCLLYVTGEDGIAGNGTACYRAAFNVAHCKPTTIHCRASEMLAKPAIQKRLTALREAVAEKACITSAEVLEIAANMARAATLAEFYNDDGSLKPPGEWTPAMKMAAAQLKTFEEYEGHGEDRKLVGFSKEIKIWDRNPAVERLFKHFGLFKKDNEQTKPEATVVIVPAKADVASSY